MINIDKFKMHERSEYEPKISAEPKQNIVKKTVAP